VKRGPGPSRRTPLTRSAPLRARARSAGHVDPGQTPPAPSRRSQGAGTPIPPALAAYILERAEGCCDWCGRYCLNGWYSRQHRQPRGMGGRAGAHTAANLVLLCGSATSPGCHLRAESRIDEARGAGFRLRPDEDPDTTPILRHGLVLVLPTAEGWVVAA